MKQINRHQLAKTQLNAELAIEKKYHVEKARTKNRQELAKKYMSSTHEYVFIMGDKNTGIKRTMLGREAKLANSLSVQKYIAKEVKVISKWKCLDWNTS